MDYTALVPSVPLSSLVSSRVFVRLSASQRPTQTCPPSFNGLVAVPVDITLMKTSKTKFSGHASIRQHNNICLVGGSGFGGTDDVWLYLIGDWSKGKYSTQPVPFDGFLFANRVMVAKEAHISSSVKDIIFVPPGVYRD